MKACHERTEGIRQDWCLVAANAMLLHSHAVAIGSSLYWMLHLQCRVLITHGAVVKVQIGLNVHYRKPALVCHGKCLSCVYIPHRCGWQLCNENTRKGTLVVSGIIQT